MKTLICTTVGLLLLATGLPASAQEPVPSERLRCEDPNGGIVRGVLLNESTQQPISGRRVAIRPIGDGVTGWCHTITDRAGNFEISGVPPGAYHAAPGDLPLRRVDPVSIDVQPGLVIELELRTLPGYLTVDCQEVPACAALLETRPRLVAHLSHKERMVEAVWRTTIALAGKDWESNWVPCADVEDEQIRQALQERVPALVPTSECERIDHSRPGQEFIRQITHLETGRPARIIRVSAIDEVPEGVDVRSGYIAGSRHAEGWRCLFSEESEGWMAQWCYLEWIS